MIKENNKDPLASSSRHMDAQDLINVYNIWSYGCPRLNVYKLTSYEVYTINKIESTQVMEKKTQETRNNKCHEEIINFIHVKVARVNFFLYMIKENDSFFTTEKLSSDEFS